MEQNKDSKKPGTWFWDLPGSAELSIPSADFKKGEKGLLQAVRKAYGDSISDMSLQDVHYNLPIGTNRKNMENNMVSLLTEEIDNHPLKSYSTLAEDDKFVIVGDTQSRDIRAYRKLSGEEVVKALTDYARNNDISIAPMDKELQELASKILVKPKEQVFYSEAAYLNFPGEIREFEEMRKKNDFKGMFKYARVLDHGDAISQRDTFRNPVHDPLDELLKEDDKYAVIYNHQHEVYSYSIFRKITEEDVRRAVKENGLDPYASADVREVFDRYWAEKTSIDKRKPTDNSQDNVLREETVSGYKKEQNGSEEFNKKGYVVWDKKEFPNGYRVQPLSREEFPLVGHLPLCPISTVEGAKENADKPCLMFDVGNERLALYILSKAGKEAIDKQRFAECVSTFNQIRTLYEENRARAPEISGFDRSSVDNDIVKGYFYINIQTPNDPTDSYTMVMSPGAVSHGYRSENQLAYAESRNTVVIRTTQKEFDQISSEQKEVVSSMSEDALDDELKGALSRMNRNLDIIKNADEYAHFKLYQDRFKRDAIKELGRIEAIYERTFIRDAKQLEGMYYYDSLNEDYISIGKLRYDENSYPHYKLDTPQGSVNAYAIIDDYHEGLLRTKEQVLKIHSKQEYNNKQNTLSMSETEKSRDFMNDNTVLSMTNGLLFPGYSKELDNLIASKDQQGIVAFFEKNNVSQEIDGHYLYKEDSSLLNDSSQKKIAEGRTGLVTYNSDTGNYEYYHRFTYRQVQDRFGSSAWAKGQNPHEGFSPSDGLIDVLQEIANYQHDIQLKEQRSKLERTIDNQNSTTMSQKEKPQVKQENASLTTPKAESKEKTANERNEEQEQKQHRPPQMVTANGEKVSHAHAFQSNKNPEDWFFTARLDGQQLRPQIMSKEDVKAYQEKAIKVEELMQHYYPTKLAKKITPEEYKADTKLSDGRTVDRMVVYKEHDENRPDTGKYKLYAQVGDQKMSRTMSKEDLNAYFDRVTTPAKLVEKNFGEQLHMASAYKKYQLPDNSGVEKVSIHKNSEGRYVISANMGDKGMTPERKMEWNDLYSYFTAKTVTREQLAAKYLMSDIRAMHTQKNDVSRGLKI